VLKGYSNKTVSLALAVYNGMPYLQEQLESFSRQTVLPSELIIFDDGSTDASVEVCRSFAANVSFKVAVYENKQNLGYTKNFEKALSMCTGEIVFISDQDDVWHDNKIEYILNEFEKSDANLIIHDLMLCDNNMIPINETKLERIISYTDPMNSYVTGMATAVRRSFLSLCLPVPDGMEYDNWIHKCASLVETKEIVNKVLADYRRHSSNVTAGRAVNSLDPMKKPSRRKKKHRSLTNSIKRKYESSYNLLNWLNNNADFIENILGESSLNMIGITRRMEDKVRRNENRLLIRNSKNIISRVEKGLRYLTKDNYGSFRFHRGFRDFLKDIIVC